jgi:hypothetical protein
MPRSFEEIVLPHLDAAFNYARWLTKNDADASRSFRSRLRLPALTGSRIELHRALRVSHARQDKSTRSRLGIEPLLSVHSHVPAQQLRLAGATLSLPAE